MPNRILCKFFARGACLKGDRCNYAHDLNAPADKICTYYQRGACAYGSRCRNNHVKVSRGQSSGSSSSTVLDNADSSASSTNLCNLYKKGACAYGSRCKFEYVKVSGVQSACSSSSTGLEPSLVASSGVTISQKTPVTSGEEEEVSSVSKQPIAARSQQSKVPDTLEGESSGEPRGERPTDQVICSSTAGANCTKEENCPHPSGKHCLHPVMHQGNASSIASEKIQKHLETLKRSQEIECSVCLERVLSKPEKEQKFGLLSECDHPFCMTCIMTWRHNSPSSGMDVKTLRACPICRKLSYYVVPSATWYFSKEEKEEIIANYKAKKKSEDCRNFKFGNGFCRFGDSCFYKHTVKPGSLVWKRTLNPSMYNMEDIDEYDFYDDFGDDFDEEYDFYGYDFDEDEEEDEEEDEPLNICRMNALRVLFEHLNRPPSRIGEGTASESTGEMAVLRKLDELQKKYSGDYDEEDFLTPWQRAFMWSQLGYDISDDEIF